MAIDDILGYVGGGILSFQLIPQIYKVQKNKSSSDLSFFFLFLNILGLGLMCTYGFLNQEKPLYITTGISLVNTVVLCFFKLYYDQQYSLTSIEALQQGHVVEPCANHFFKHSV